MTSSSSGVFCDWLNVTFHPEDSPVAGLRDWLDALLFPVSFADPAGGVVCISVGLGTLRIELKERFHLVSASGSVLAHLRSMGEFEAYLSVLALHPHKVTRLDAARDYSVDAPVFLRALEGRYPGDRVSLQRKALRVTRFYSCRASDGLLTGTWYAGHRSSARVTARVYDKQEEALEKRGEVLPPTTRVELTFKKDHGCTLRDAAMPYSLFHQFASPSIVPKPVDAPGWVAHGEGWTPSPIVPALPFALFERRVATSPEIEHLASLAERFGPEGLPVVLRAFEKSLRARLAVGEPGIAQDQA